MKTKSIFSRSTWMLAVVVMLAMSLASCEKSLPEKLEGKWSGSMSKSFFGEDADVLKNAKVTFDFKKESEDGGSFVAEFAADTKSDENGVAMTAKIKFSIPGEWKTKDGKLGFTGKFSDAKASVKITDIKPSASADEFTRQYIEEAINSGELDKDALEDELLNVFNQQIQSSEDDDDESIEYKDVTIDGETLTFEFRDEGKLKLRRVKD